MTRIQGKLLGGVSALALFAGLGADEARAQIACVAGVQANACTVAAGQTVLGVITNVAGSTIDNAGTITNQLRTNDANSAVTNSGTVGSYIRTTGVGSGVTNIGSVGTFIVTNGANSGVTNSGSVGDFLQTTGVGSSVTNSGSVGTFIQTVDDNSAVTNSGSVGTFIFTTVANSAVTNSGTVGTYLATGGVNSGVTNSGSVGTLIVTNGANSGVTNSGSVGTFIRTVGTNSAVTNSGSVGSYIYTVGANSAVTNSGTVVRFIRTIDANSAVTNSGSVGSGAAGHGVFITGANPNLTLLPGSNIQGTIDLSGAGTRTLSVGNGLSVANTFITGPNVINSNGAPFAVNGLSVAVVDPTNLAAQDELLADLTGGISSTVQNRLGSLRNGGVAGVTTNPRPMGIGGTSKNGALVEDTRRQGWAQAFGSYRLQRGDGGPNVDADIRLGGLVSGFDGVSGNGTRLGVFFGGSQAEVEADFNSQDTDVDSLFGGFYASMLKGSTAVDFKLTVGYSDYDRERRVANNLAAGGIQTAKADYDGWFISPELTMTRPLWQGAQRFEKSLTLRYSGLFLDGFTENGTAAPLTVNDRDIHVLQARTQLTMPVEHHGMDGSSNRSAFFIGLEGRAQVGDDDVTGTLLAQNITFNPGGDDAVAGVFAGLEFERTSAGGTTLFASVEGQVETGGGRQASGKAGIKFRF